jgi:hypothetical protein
MYTGQATSGSYHSPSLLFGKHSSRKGNIIGRMNFVFSPKKVTNFFQHDCLKTEWNTSKLNTRKKNLLSYTIQRQQQLSTVELEMQDETDTNRAGASEFRMPLI